MEIKVAVICFVELAKGDECQGQHNASNDACTEQIFLLQIFCQYREAESQRDHPCPCEVERCGGHQCPDIGAELFCCQGEEHNGEADTETHRREKCIIGGK